MYVSILSDVQLIWNYKTNFLHKRYENIIRNVQPICLFHKWSQKALSRMNTRFLKLQLSRNFSSIFSAFQVNFLIIPFIISKLLAPSALLSCFAWQFEIADLDCLSYLCFYVLLLLFLLFDRNISQGLLLLLFLLFDRNISQGLIINK